MSNLRFEENLSFLDLSEVLNPGRAQREMTVYGQILTNGKKKFEALCQFSASNSQISSIWSIEEGLGRKAPT